MSPRSTYRLSLKTAPPLNVDLLPDEVVTFEPLDRTLKSDPVFLTAYPNAKLTGIDLNLGIQENEAGGARQRVSLQLPVTFYAE